jgi:hypothetical protein
MVVSLAWAKPPQAKHLNAPPQKRLNAPPQKQLKSLPPATQLQKQFARDAEDVRLVILASPT